MPEVLFDRKEQINEIAQNLFRTKGYAATSMRDLAREIGIEPASIYSHVKSKEALLQKICFRIADEFFEALQQVLEPSLVEFKSLRNKYEKQFRSIIEEGVASGEFDKVDAHVSVKLLFAMMNSIYEWYNPKGKLKRKEIVRNIVETYVNGIVRDK
jgi:TetR/AcrR family transcriptional regulator, cholesterol catabolism regulator